MNKTLILVRHGHRSKALGHEVDNGVSSKGSKQAARIERRFRKLYPDEEALVVSSPKRRCIETVAPLVHDDESKIQIMASLDEDGNVEQKAKDFIRWWRDEGPMLTVACSHGDWLPVAVKLLTGAKAELKKGAWAEIEEDEGNVKLTWLVQEL
ncbi:MAG: histidine phosphatase family protein [Deltaproteobacteria bacterium]|nr:histidine phosphatase family protein [Deltaproteobacteria bacterium]